MSEDETSHKDVTKVLSTSPREDYDPLVDDGSFSNQDLEDEEDPAPDDDSLCNSIGLGQEPIDPYMYGVTPPINSRAMKREKEKSRTGKFSNKNEIREIVSDVNKVRRSPQKPVRSEHTLSELQSYGDDVLPSSKDSDVEQSDSKRSSSSAKKRRASGNKTYKTLRGQDRDFKQTESTSLSGSIPNSSLSAYKVMAKSETPSHFKSLDSKQVVNSHQSSSVTPPSTASYIGSLQNTFLTQHKVAKERIDFYKTFQMLIRLGNRAGKEKENKGAVYRQMSYEQEEWQTKYSDIIWLEIRAYLCGRKRGEQDDLYYRLQQYVPLTLQRILTFKVKNNTCTSSSRNPVSQYFVNKQENTIAEEDDSSNAQGIFTHEMEVDDCETPLDCIQPKSSSVLVFDQSMSDVMHEQKNALLQVAAILRELESVEQLYPTYKAVGRANPVYAEPAFQSRLRTLYLWMNITMEMGSKLHLMARMLQIANHEHLDIEWPWKEINPKQYLNSHLKTKAVVNNPHICVTQPSNSSDEEDDDYYDEEDEDYTSTEDSEDYDSDDDLNEEVPTNKLCPPKKNVHFDLSDSSSSAPITPETELPPGGVLFPKPGDTSTPSKPNPPSRSTSQVSVSRSSSLISFEDSTRTAIYRDYTDRLLKKTGVTKLQARMKDLLEGPLQRARGALEKPKVLPTYASVTSIEHNPSEMLLSSSPSMDGFFKPPVVVQEAVDSQTSLTDNGVWSTAFQQIALPSFKPTYLFLVRIPLDVIHECLRLRLEQRPKKDPSLYSIRHLIIECKEVLQAATTMKIYYQQMVNAVMTEDDPSDLNLDQFEDDLEKMLEVYVEYLRLYMIGLQKISPGAMSKHLKNFLEEEWRFAKEIIPYVQGGEGNAANKFCIMGTSLLQSISEFLECGLRECLNRMCDRGFSHCLEDGEKDSESEGENEHDREVRRALTSKRNSRSVEFRKETFVTCRRLKELFNEARERVAKALSFAKMLRKDLEIAAEYSTGLTTQALLKKLKDTNHYRVLTALSSGFAMFIPVHIVSDVSQILHLLNITCGREDLINPDMRTYSRHKLSHPDIGKDNSPQPKPDGYLVIVPCLSGQFISECWDGESLHVESNADISVALSPNEVSRLLLVVLHSSQLISQRKDFEGRIGNAVQLVSEQISCYTMIAESIQELKNEAIVLRDKVDDAVKKVEEKLSLEEIADMEETEKNNIQNRYRETLLRCYNFGCEYHDELLRLVSYDMRTQLYPCLIDMAKRWMHFATTKCEKGRGRRPKWAHVGLNFLTVAINPMSISCMTEEEFQNIKSMLNACIHHVIGEKSTHIGSAFRVSSPDVTSQRHVFSRIQSCPEPSLPSMRNSNTSTGSRTAVSESSVPASSTLSDLLVKKSVSANESTFEDPQSPLAVSPGVASPKELSEIFFNGEEDFPRLDKMCAATNNLERNRNKNLRNNKVIGRRSRKDKEVDMSSLVNVRPVKFRWQRTTKIGEGRFGKVYTAVNTNSGDLMAMKEMKFQSNDIQYIKKIVDEIRNLENISGHPSLVQYFGVEVHTDEIYIFMEYCPGGTIADAAKQGLTEDLIRKYTNEILVAINVLHEHNIVHRDIKGPNIFLTEKGPLKLGDLGCAVQLKSHNTMPGEVKGMEGTAAYMAPEVFTNHEGGRASDIWSLGCTVIEMATGKRPWPDLENQFQIMYKVGMGESPSIPSFLSDEGQDFIKHCLEHDPKSRSTASMLQGHSFVKIYDLHSDEDNEETR